MKSFNEFLSERTGDQICGECGHFASREELRSAPPEANGVPAPCTNCKCEISDQVIGKVGEDQFQRMIQYPRSINNCPFWTRGLAQYLWK